MKALVLDRTYNRYVMICHCGKEYVARRVDLERSWGLSCSKVCAGKRREKNLPPATIKGGYEI